MESQLSYALRYIDGTGGTCLSDEQAIRLIEICEKKLARSKGHLYFCYPPEVQSNQLILFRISYPGFMGSFRETLSKRGYSAIHPNQYAAWSHYCSDSYSTMVDVDTERKLLVHLDWGLRPEPNKIHLQIPNCVIKPLKFDLIKNFLSDIYNFKQEIVIISGKLFDQ